MVASGLVAAFMVTPRPDEEALARPDEADVVVAAGPPLSWDPAAIADSTSAQMLSQVFEGLTVLDADVAGPPGAGRDRGRSPTTAAGIEFVLRDGPDLQRRHARSTPRTCAAPGCASSTLSDPARSRACSTTSSVPPPTRAARPRRGRRHPGRRPRLRVEFVASGGLLPGRGGRAHAGRRARGHRRPWPRGPRWTAPSPPAAPTCRPGDVGGGPAARPTRPTGPVRRRSSASASLTDIGGRSEVDVFEDEAVDWTRISPDDAAWIRYDRELGPQLRAGDDMVVEFLGFDTTEPALRRPRRPTGRGHGRGLAAPGRRCDGADARPRR